MRSRFMLNMNTQSNTQAVIFDLEQGVVDIDNTLPAEEEEDHVDYYRIQGSAGEVGTQHG